MRQGSVKVCKAKVHVLDGFCSGDQSKRVEYGTLLGNDLPVHTIPTMRSSHGFLTLGSQKVTIVVATHQ